MRKPRTRFGAILLAVCMLVSVMSAMPVFAATVTEGNASAGSAGGGGGSSSSVAEESVTAMFTNVSHMGSFTVIPSLTDACDVLVSGYNQRGILTDVALLQNVDLSAGSTVVNNAGEGFDFSAAAESYQIVVLEDLGTLKPAIPVGSGTISKTVKETPAIYLAGDSTVCNYGDDQFPRTGWGMVFDNYLTDGAATIVNKAVSGTSTRSFKYDTSKDPDGTTITQRYTELQNGSLSIVGVKS